MDAASPLLLLSVALGASGVAVLRYAWALSRRSVGLNAAGWALLATAVVAGWGGGGAWGVAMASIAARLAACVALAVAGLRSPPGKARSPNRRADMLPEAGEPRRIGRRFGTFAIVILGGLAVSIGLAVALRGLGGALGWNEADTLVLALYLVPLFWAVLATVLLMQARRRSQIATLVLCSLPLIPVLATGGL